MHLYEALSVVCRNDCKLKAVNHTWLLQAYNIEYYLNTTRIPNNVGVIIN